MKQMLAPIICLICISSTARAQEQQPNFRAQEQQPNFRAQEQQPNFRAQEQQPNFRAQEVEPFSAGRPRGGRLLTCLLQGRDACQDPPVADPSLENFHILIESLETSECSGQWEFGEAYPSRRPPGAPSGNIDLNWGATDKKNSPEECQAECQETPRCEGFTWVDRLNNCWLKHEMGEHYKDHRGHGFISGHRNSCKGEAPWPLRSCGNKNKCS